MRFRTGDVRDQKAALKQIVVLIAKGSIDPTVRATAHKITRDVESRDDLGELEAIYHAVKVGDPEVKSLHRGVRYVSDPRAADFYTGARAMLDLCRQGACAGDCDDHTILVGSLAASLGFMVGARAWGPPGSKLYTHVYPVVAVPKRGPWPSGYLGHGMDTTVKEAHVGWDPPRGGILTDWLK